MHLPVSSEDALYFYRYLHTNVLIADEQFPLLINVPIHDCTQQLKICNVFNLAIHHGHFSAHCNINNWYLGRTHEETKAVEISEDQCYICQKAHEQFYSLNTPLLPLANPPMCIAPLYAKDKADIEKRCSLQIRKAFQQQLLQMFGSWLQQCQHIRLICPEEAPRFIKAQTPIHILGLLPACSAKSQHFHLPPCFETHELTINMTTSRGSMAWVPALPLGQHTVSPYWSTL